MLYTHCLRLFQHIPYTERWQETEIQSERETYTGSNYKTLQIITEYIMFAITICKSHFQRYLKEILWEYTSMVCLLNYKGAKSQRLLYITSCTCFAVLHCWTRACPAGHVTIAAVISPTFEHENNVSLTLHTSVWYFLLLMLRLYQNSILRTMLTYVRFFNDVINECWLKELVVFVPMHVLTNGEKKSPKSEMEKSYKHQPLLTLLYGCVYRVLVLENCLKYHGIV